MPNALYALGLGWLLGHRVVQITHRGRRSGLIYRTVVEVVESDTATRRIVVASSWGNGADWYRNLRAEPALEVRSGRWRFVPGQRLLTPEEAAAVMTRYRAAHSTAGRAFGWWFSRRTHALEQTMWMPPMVEFRAPSGI